MGTECSNQDIFVITAPSGTGKTTLNRRLVKDPGGIEISISLTTRPRRTGEVHGDHYWFTEEQAFKQEVEKGEMLEWANVFGNLYGTSMKELSRIRENHHKIILEIDVQGWKHAKKKLPGAISIFILPPSLETLWKRLTGRASDRKEDQWRRIRSARDELDHAQDYQYFVVNDDLESAYGELKSILMGAPANSLTREQGLNHCQNLIAEWQNSPVFAQLRDTFRPDQDVRRGQKKA